MAVRDGMYAVGPNRVRGGRIPATAATVRWEGHPHTEHGAGTWTQGSTKTAPTTTVSAGAGRRTGGGSRCRPAVWGTHNFFYAEPDPHVQPGLWSGACSGATGQRTGGDRPPTHHVHNSPDSVEVNALFRISCISFVSPCLSSGFCTVLRKLNPPYVSLLHLPRRDHKE